MTQALALCGFPWGRKRKENSTLKRLLYIAFKNFSNLHFGGNTKVLSQCRAFSEYGYDVDLIGRQDVDTVLIKNDVCVQRLSNGKVKIGNARLQNLMAKQKQFRDIKKYIQNKQYGACFIRYDFSDPGFIKLLKALRRVCPKIALELPTYPYEEENKYGLLSKAKMVVDKAFRKKLHKYIDFIVMTVKHNSAVTADYAGRFK